MIKKKTLLVLGAGSSIPYGFPSGDELANYIRSLANARISDVDTNLYAGCGTDPAEVKAFARTFRDSGVVSVDAFLSHQRHMDRACKLAICLYLGAKESPDAPQWVGNDDDWYRYLWEHMRRDAPTVNDLARNQIRIATFNYDRSLEFFLYRSIRHTYGLADAAGQQLLGDMWIRHVYGELGPFHFLGRDGGGRHYQAIQRPDELELAANSIRLIPETRKQDEIFGMIQQWFEWAEEIAFVGFSFYPENCDRLDLNKVLTWKASKGLPEPRVVACTHGMTKVEVEAARTRTCPTVKWLPVSERSLMFFRNTDLLN